MNTLTNALRRWKHPEYRYAHRHEWPTMFQWLVVMLCMAVLLSASYVFDAWRMKYEVEQRSQFILDTYGLFKGCVEGRNSLGIVVMDGIEYRELCEVKYVKVKSLAKELK